MKLRLGKQIGITLFFAFVLLNYSAVTFAANNNDLLQLTPVESQQATTSAPVTSSSQFDDESGPTEYTESELFPAPSRVQSQAFNQVARSAFPMTPTEIRQFKAMQDVSKRAAASPVGTPPRPVLSTQLVNLDPGSVPPVVRLEEGFVTSIVFTDSSGNPWPIISYDLGNSKAFNIQWQPTTNMLMVQAMSPYTYGNIAVTLKGLTTPVMLTLVPGQKVVDYRADLQIQATLPGSGEATMPSVHGTAVNLTLLDVLNGVPPDSAKVLRVTGGEAQAWLINKKLYVRTALTVLSPSWISVMKNGDGTKAYVMNQTPTILVSRYGTPVQLNIEGLSS